MASEQPQVQKPQVDKEEEEDKPEEKQEIPNPESLIKHPLQNQWQLWYYRPDKGKVWEENLLDVTAFDTVEDFWALYNHIELASSLTPGADYCIFKAGIKPMWEDDQNKFGGRWLFTFGKKVNGKSPQADEIWLEVLLCLIGEAFGEDSDQVNGAVINIRPKMDKISVWTRDKNNNAANLNIGNILKKRTHYNQHLTYEAHSDTQTKSSSVARHLLTI